MQIKNIASAREASLFDRDKTVRIPRKKKARAGVLCSKTSHKKAHKQHSTQNNFVLCEKVGMTDLKYMLHSSEYCTVMCANRTMKYGMGGYMVISTDTVKHYKKYEKME